MNNKFENNVAPVSSIDVSEVLYSIKCVILPVEKHGATSMQALDSQRNFSIKILKKSLYLESPKTTVPHEVKVLRLT